MTRSPIAAAGIYRDFPEADYFADPCPVPSFSQSIGKVLLDYSPAHARLEHPRLAPKTAEDDEPEVEKYDSAKAIGNAAHKLMLGRGREIAEAKFNNFQSKAAKEFRADADAAGKLVVLSKHLARAHDMVKAAREQLDLTDHYGAFVGGHSEIMLAWHEGDLWLRQLLDWSADLTVVADYKTSGMSCAPHAVAERPSEAGWDVQAAMAERGLDVLDPDNAGRRKFVFVAQENWAPYALSVVEISEADLTMGRKKLAMAIDLWGNCMRFGKWPAYTSQTIVSRPRPYLEQKTLVREIEHHERKQAEGFNPELIMAG